jgi:hypothetical protein
MNERQQELQDVSGQSGSGKKSAKKGEKSILKKFLLIYRNSLLLQIKKPLESQKTSR